MVNGPGGFRKGSEEDAITCFYNGGEIAYAQLRLRYSRGMAETIAPILISTGAVTGTGMIGKEGTQKRRTVGIGIARQTLSVATPQESECEEECKCKACGSQYGGKNKSDHTVVNIPRERL
jgi:hypothetical protein